jgi:hypothetical protein
MREDVGQCEACWVRPGPGGRRLAVDHANENTWDLRRDNLTVLCARCHLLKKNSRRRFMSRREVIRWLQACFDAERAQEGL